MKFECIIKRLNSFAPLNLAESWDNVGVLLEPPNMRCVSKILLTNDLTLAVMDEAEEKGVEMILSYHPPIFKPLKSITTSHWKEIIVGRCLAKGIAIYSPHTSYDAVKGGVNDWLISAFGKGDVKPIHPSYTTDKWSHKVELELQGKSCSNTSAMINLCAVFENDGIEISQKSDESLTLLCDEKSILYVLQSREKLGIDFVCTITKLEKIPIPNHGMGRFALLDQPLTLRDAVERVRKHLRLAHVRLAMKHGGTKEDMIQSVAVCAGSGVSVVRNCKTDLILTGEMSHHEVLDLAQMGSHVILTDHSNSERGFLSDVLQERLTKDLESKVEVLVSEKDADPLVVV